MSDRPIEANLTRKQASIVRFIAAVRVALFGVPGQHRHKWHTINHFKSTLPNGNVYSMIYINQCLKCGEIKKENIVL